MPKRRIEWTAEGRSDLRAIDRDTALRILKGLDRYLQSGHGGTKALEGFHPPLIRLRVGPWRIVFEPLADDAIRVTRVLHRSQAYRQ